MARVVIGRIRAAHGIRGEMKVETYDTTSITLRKGKVIFLASETAARTIRNVRPQRDWQLVELEGVNTRNDAEALIGREVAIERDELPKLARGEFYIADVVGYTMVTPAGERVGIIEGATEAGQTILIVRGAEGSTRAGKEILIPCVEGILLEVRTAARELLIDPPEGLLDL